jgi:hypothetical protein
MQSGAGPEFSIDPTTCQYTYNLEAYRLGAGTYYVYVIVDGGGSIGSAKFAIW